MLLYVFLPVTSTAIMGFVRQSHETANGFEMAEEKANVSPFQRFS